MRDAFLRDGVGERLRDMLLTDDVGKTFSESVVANMNFTWAGGSSKVFSSALKAAVESI